MNVPLFLLFVERTLFLVSSVFVLDTAAIAFMQLWPHSSVIHRWDHAAISKPFIGAVRMVRVVSRSWSGSEMLCAGDGTMKSCDGGKVTSKISRPRAVRVPNVTCLPM